MKQQKKLLSIDGGGIRGMIALRVLRKIETLLRQQRSQPSLVLADYFDYIGGTSTGGIVAAALSIGMSVDEIEAFYRSAAPSLFSPVNNPVRRMLFARYDSTRLAAKLKEVFGADTTLGSERIKTLLMLVMLNASTSSPWPVSNNPRALFNDAALGGDSNLNLPLWQLVRASTAAPYFFDPEEIRVGPNHYLFYDGGLTSLNNPAYKLFQMATLAPYRVNWATGADRLLLVSVGTGLVPKEVVRHSMVEKQVGATLVNALQSLMYASISEVDIQCRCVAKVLAGEPIDSEVGDFIGQAPVGEQALFSYVRYNTSLTPSGLSRLGCADLAGKSTFRLDDLSALGPCTKVGDALAEKVVQPSHFADFV